jgi:hypothetical protein
MRSNRTLSFLGGRALYPIIIIGYFVTSHINCSTRLIEVRRRAATAAAVLDCCCCLDAVPLNLTIAIALAVSLAFAVSLAVAIDGKVLCRGDALTFLGGSCCQHVGDMLATCRPDKHMSVFLTLLSTCQHPTSH